MVSAENWKPHTPTARLFLRTKAAAGGGAGGLPVKAGPRCCPGGCTGTLVDDAVSIMSELFFPASLDASLFRTVPSGFARSAAFQNHSFRLRLTRRFPELLFLTLLFASSLRAVLCQCCLRLIFKEPLFPVSRSTARTVGGIGFPLVRLVGLAPVNSDNRMKRLTRFWVNKSPFESCG